MEIVINSQRRVKTNIFFVNDEKLINSIKDENTFIIIDSNVAELHRNLFAELNDKIIIVNSQNCKNINTFYKVCETIMQKHANKSTQIIGIGGGQVLDLTGFIASVYMRGIDVAFVPTTTLAVFDAAFGGKNAINFGNVKNLIGTIYHPRNVYINTNLLKTLPYNHIIAGFAEALKIAFMFNNELTQSIIEFLNTLNQRQNTMPNAHLIPIIKRCIELKADVVKKDEFDNNFRKVLNFGHSIGHLLEIEYNLLHGEAVAYGMLYETKLATTLQLTTNNVYNEIYSSINNYFPQKQFNLKKLLPQIIYDKKYYDGKITLPVITELGQVELYEIDVQHFALLIDDETKTKNINNSKNE